MAEPLVILGAGGFGRETADVVEAVNAAGKPAFDLLGVVDDNPSAENRQRLTQRGIDYLGTTADLIARKDSPHFVVGIGNPEIRRAIAETLEAAGLRPATLIHPTATLGSQVTVGAGTVICAGARITTNIRLGRHVHVNPNCTIGHDTVLEDYVSMNPASSISGDCFVRQGALIGVAAVVLNQLTVGAGAVVGGSACVVREVPAGVVVKGVPAR